MERETQLPMFSEPEYTPVPKEPPKVVITYVLEDKDGNRTEQVIETTKARFYDSIEEELDEEVWIVGESIFLRYEDPETGETDYVELDLNYVEDWLKST